MPAVVITLVAVVAALAGLAPDARAQGVFVDPDSPSGREYALPLEEARRTTDSEPAVRGKVLHGERTAPLFGEGIEAEEPAVAPRPRRHSRGDRSGTRGKGGRDRGSGGVSVQSLPAAVRAATAEPGAPTGGSMPLLLGGSALALLGAGAAVGAAIRRRRR